MVEQYVSGQTSPKGDRANYPELVNAKLSRTLSDLVLVNAEESPGLGQVVEASTAQEYIK